MCFTGGDCTSVSRWKRDRRLILSKVHEAKWTAEQWTVKQVPTHTHTSYTCQIFSIPGCRSIPLVVRLLSATRMTDAQVHFIHLFFTSSLFHAGFCLLVACHSITVAVRLLPVPRMLAPQVHPVHLINIENFQPLCVPLNQCHSVPVPLCCYIVTWNAK